MCRPKSNEEIMGNNENTLYDTIDAIKKIRELYLLEFTPLGLNQET